MRSKPEWQALLRDAADEELPVVWALAMEELRRRGIVRSSNNPVADIAEALVADTLGLRLAPKGAQGYDAEGDDGRRYQVKSRRLTGHNRRRRARATSASSRTGSSMPWWR